MKNISFRKVILIYQRLYILLIAIYALLDIQDINPFVEIQRIIQYTLAILSILSIIYVVIDCLKNKEDYEGKRIGIGIDIILIVIFNIVIFINL